MVTILGECGSWIAYPSTWWPLLVLKGRHHSKKRKQYVQFHTLCHSAWFTICYPRPYLPYEVLWSFFDDFALWPVCSLGPNNFENFEFFKPVLETLGPNKFICETKNHNLFSIVPESAIKLIYTIKHEP